MTKTTDHTSEPQLKYAHSTHPNTAGSVVDTSFLLACLFRTKILFWMDLFDACTRIWCSMDVASSKSCCTNFAAGSFPPTSLCVFGTQTRTVPFSFLAKENRSMCFHIWLFTTPSVVAMASASCTQRQVQWSLQQTQCSTSGGWNGGQQDN